MVLRSGLKDPPVLTEIWQLGRVALEGLLELSDACGSG